MFSHGWFRMSTNIQLMLLPEASGNRNEPRKFHNQTLANLSAVASLEFGGKVPKRSLSHIDVTPETFLKNDARHRKVSTCDLIKVLEGKFKTEASEILTLMCPPLEASDHKIAAPSPSSRHCQVHR